MAAEGLRHGSLGESCIHLCVDMQRLFGPGYPWAVPWLERVLPLVEELCELHPERTVFTRFVPAAKAGQGHGTWALLSPVGGMHPRSDWARGCKAATGP